LTWRKENYFWFQKCSKLKWEKNVLLFRKVYCQSSDIII
jgi:hypothetical protein